MTKCRDCEDPAFSPGDNKISILRYSNGNLEFKVVSERGGWLVFSEAHLPGWIAEIYSARDAERHASEGSTKKADYENQKADIINQISNGVNGRRIPIYTANYLFQAIKIPAGEHRVEFRYIGSLRLFLQKLRGI